jgi:hypothetical protein
MLLVGLNWVFAHMPLRIKQMFCGLIAPGHHYNLEIIRIERGDGLHFVVDPLARCTHCQLLLPENAYQRAIDSYTASVTAEDEVW